MPDNSDEFNRKIGENQRLILVAIEAFERGARGHSLLLRQRLRELLADYERFGVVVNDSLRELAQRYGLNVKD